MKRDEETRKELFYERKQVKGTDCFVLYYLRSDYVLWPIGISPGFRSQFNKAYGIGRPGNMELLLIDKIISRSNSNYIKSGEAYSAQLLINGKPAEGFNIKNLVD